jgi:hypothetical protein
MDSSGLEEDDDWSRQVERDESQRGMALDGEEEDDDDDAGGIRSTLNGSEAASNSMIHPPNGGTPATQQNNMHMHMGDPPSNRLAPKREEPTLKEKLVERERQRRVETEMARLKRQFALSSSRSRSHHSDEDDQDDGQEDDNDDSNRNHNANSINEGEGVGGDVARAVGDESSVHDGDGGEPDDKEGEPSNKQLLTYPMERFLQEQGTVNIQEESQQREHNKRDTIIKGVVMERFLKDPIVVEPSDPDRGQHNNLDRTVSFEMEPPPPSRAKQSTQQIVGEASSLNIMMSNRSHEASMEDNNASVEVNPSIRNGDSENDVDELPHNVGPITSDSLLEVQQHHHNEPYSPTADRDRPSSTTSSEPPPRVMRLTEAEIQEMAAIEEASIGNAPPSDREDDISVSSFVGELQTDFGAPAAVVDPMGTLSSQGTAPTASMIESNQSSPPSIDRGHEDHSLDDIDTGSEASSDDGNSVSVVANPPSERAPSEHERGSTSGGEAPTSPWIPSEIIHLSSSPTTRTIEQLGTDSPERLLQGGGVARAPPQIPSAGLDDSGGPLDLEKSLVANVGVVNRQIRPGMMNFKHKQPEQRGARSPASPMRRALSMPDTLLTFDVDGFDYDKHDPLSPRSGLSDSIRDFPPDDVVWSPLLDHEKMIVSPLRVVRNKRSMPSAPSIFAPRPDVVGGVTASYGTLGGVLSEEETPHIQFRPSSIPPNFDSIFQDDEEKKDEGRPLLGSHAPRELSVRRAYISELLSGEFPIRSLVDDVFSDIRSVSTATESHQNYEAKEYLETNILARGEFRRVVVFIIC